MYEILQPPAGSSIQAQQDIEGFRLQWKHPHAPLLARIPTGIFLTFWLSGWTLGGIMAVGVLFSSDSETPLFGRLFLACWLIGWAAGEYFAITSFFNLFRPPQPAQLRWDDLTLTWDPGSDVEKAMMLTGRKNSDPQSPRPSKKQTFPKQEIDRIRLDQLGDRQRLILDVGVQRIEIGRELTEPEREWLAGILMTWKES